MYIFELNRQKNLLSAAWDKLVKTSVPPEHIDYQRYQLSRAASFITPVMMAISYGVMTSRNSEADISNLKDFPAMCCIYLVFLARTLAMRHEIREGQKQKEKTEKSFDFEN